MTTGDTLVVYHGETAAPFRYDNSVWRNVFDSPMAEPVLEDGSLLFEEFVDRFEETLHVSPESPLCGDVLREEVYCPPSSFTSKLARPDGETEDIADYDTVLVSTHWIYLRYIEYVATEFPETTLIGIHEDSLQEIQYASPGLQAATLKGYQALDGFVSYTDSMTAWTKPIVDNVAQLHHPITPEMVERIRDVGRGIAERESICLGINHWNYDFDNIVSSLAAYGTIRDSHPDLQPYILGVRSYKQGQYQPFVDRYPELEIIDFLHGEEFYKRLAETTVILQPTVRAVAGRISAEAAALGVSVIGNGRTDMQMYCWPDLACDPFDTETVVRKLERLLTEEPYKHKVVRTAADRLDRLSQRLHEQRSEVEKLANGMS